jgi:hypothetical protein
VPATVKGSSASGAHGRSSRRRACAREPEPRAKDPPPRAKDPPPEAKKEPPPTPPPRTSGDDDFLVPPGFYPDPDGSDRRRWWDGVKWTRKRAA